MTINGIKAGYGHINQRPAQKEPGKYRRINALAAAAKNIMLTSNMYNKANQNMDVKATTLMAVLT